MPRLLLTAASVLVFSVSGASLAKPPQGNDKTITVTAEATGATDPSKDPEQVVCRRYVETGSLAKKRKVCKTRRQWTRDGELARSDTSDSTLRGLSSASPQPSGAVDNGLPPR